MRTRFSKRKPKQKEHDWEKSCLVTQSKGGRIFDTYRCKCCGATGKRFGLGWPPTMDKKFEKQMFCKAS